MYDTTTLDARIINGETAAIGTWAWAASLKLDSDNPHICGGTVIGEQHILTAAHCIADLSEYGYSIYDIEVRLGLNTISYPGSNVESYSLQSAKIHPNYDTYNTGKGYDIAILTLNRKIDFNRNRFISKICLPFLNSTPPTDLANPEYPLPNTDLVAIGWGVTREGSHITSDTLQQVTLQAVDKYDSRCRFPGNSLIPAQNNNPQIQMCATGLGKDTCQGDSGGPLMMFRSDAKVWEFVGITSFGRGCAERSYSGVYTRVAAYLDWIKQNTPTAAPTQPTTTTLKPTQPTTTTSKPIQTITSQLLTQSSTPRLTPTPYHNSAQRISGYGGLIMIGMSLFLYFSV